jgi:hypothetical protein
MIKLHAMRTCRENGSTVPQILNLSTRLKRLVSFTHRPSYPQRRPWYTQDKRLETPEPVWTLWIREK